MSPPLSDTFRSNLTMNIASAFHLVSPVFPLDPPLRRRRRKRPSGADDGGGPSLLPTSVDNSDSDSSIDRSDPRSVRPRRLPFDNAKERDVSRRQVLAVSSSSSSDSSDSSSSDSSSDSSIDRWARAILDRSRRRTSYSRRERRQLSGNKTKDTVLPWTSPSHSFRSPRTVVDLASFSGDETARITPTPPQFRDGSSLATSAASDDGEGPSSSSPRPPLGRRLVEALLSPLQTGDPAVTRAEATQEGTRRPDSGPADPADKGKDGDVGDDDDSLECWAEGSAARSLASCGEGEASDGSDDDEEYQDNDDDAGSSVATCRGGTEDTARRSHLTIDWEAKVRRRMHLIAADGEQHALCSIVPPSSSEEEEVSDGNCSNRRAGDNYNNYKGHCHNDDEEDAGGATIATKLKNFPQHGLQTIDWEAKVRRKIRQTAVDCSQVVHDIVQSVVPSLSSSEDEDLTDSDGPGKRSNNKHGVLHPTMQSVVPPLSSSEDEDLTDSNGPNERMSNTPRIFAEGRQAQLSCYNVHSIIGRRLTRDRLDEYLVRWEDTWMSKEEAIQTPEQRWSVRDHRKKGAAEEVLLRWWPTWEPPENLDAACVQEG